MSVVALSEISGISTSEVETIIVKVKENHRLLAGCSRHTFGLPVNEKPFGGHWKCMTCGGEVDAMARHWYQLGMKHAKAG